MYPWLKRKLLTYCIVSFVSGFFPDVSAATPISMFSLWSCRFVLLIFYAKVTVLMERMKYDRFLQVVAEHVTIIWPVLFDHLTIFFAQNTRRLPILSNVFPINFHRIRVEKKYKHMLVLKNKRKVQNYEKLRVVGLFCYTRVFWCNIRMFPISYKHFTHVGILQSRYKQCKVEWLLSTWSDYVWYFASSLSAIISTT